MEYGIWNIHNGLWATNAIAYNNAPAVYTTRLPQFPFQNTTITTIPEIFKNPAPSQTVQSSTTENETQQSDSDTNGSSAQSSTSQNVEQKETQTEPDTYNDNASDFISNFGLNSIKIENSLAFINQQLNPVYNLMLNRMTQRQESDASVDSDKTVVSKENSCNSNGKDLFECSVCHAALKDNEELQRHLEVKHFNNEVIVSTRPCTQNELIVNNETNDKKNYSDNSNSSVRRQERLSLQRVRYEREEYRCTLCTYTCTIEKAFYRHLRAHSNNTQENEVLTAPRISCVICGKDRASENDMLRHMQRHKDNRHFCCDICVFRTVQLKKLIQHRRMHTGEKPHLCPHCIYRSARRDNLRSHVRRVHKKDNLFCDTFSPRGLLLTSTARNINEDKY